MKKSEFRVEIFHGPSGLDALAADWRTLFDALERPSYVHLWEWHRCFLESLAPDPAAMCFGAFYEGAALVAILPLMFVAAHLQGVFVRLASVPAHAHVRHGDILVHPRVQHRFDLDWALAAMRRRVGRPWDVTRLGPAPEGSCAGTSVRALWPGGLAASELDSGSDALVLSGPEPLVDTLSKNFRGALRKARNKLGKLPGVSLTWAREPAALDAAFPRFLDVEASGWKGSAGESSAIQLEPALRAFYGGLVRRLGPSGRCRINLLMHGDRVMAGQFGIVAGERYYLLKIGYDESYKQEAPGNMLLERLLGEMAAEPEIHYLDLVSDAAWHRSWKPLQRQVFVHYVFHHSPRGAVAWAAVRGKQILRPTAHRLRARADALIARIRAVRAGHADAPASEPAAAGRANSDGEGAAD